MRKVIFTLLGVTYTLYANSGRRQDIDSVPQLPSHTRAIIKKIAEQAVKDSAWVIDSIIGRQRIIVIEDIPGRHSQGYKILWHYTIRGTDTIFTHTTIEKI